MALMETHYYSHSLGNNVTLNVFVPTLSSDESITDVKVQEKYNYQKGLPVLYLLHGAYGDAFSWVRYSNIDRYAQEKGMVVVMASAENSFYQDLRSGKKYKTFFAEELPKFISDVFPVSTAREDTYIAGFSMGGYGAWFLGLTYPERYAKAASLSGATDLPKLYQTRETGNTPFNWQDIFGDLDSLTDTPYDLLFLYDKAVKAGRVPELYQAVGFDDFLYEDNLGTKFELEKRGAKLHYEEGQGGHNWDFWDSYIRHILDWLLEK